MKVFISYARETLAEAQLVATAVENNGYEVWFDQSLLSHRSYTDLIEEALSSSDAALVLWSEAATRSEWVRSEANRAREDRKLVQVTLDQCRLPMPFDQIHAIALPVVSGFESSSAWQSVLETLRTVSLTQGSPEHLQPQPKKATDRQLSPDPHTQSSAIETSSIQPEREKRQITAMHCDFNLLAAPGTEIDPEDKLDITSEFPKVVARIAREEGGYLLQIDQRSALIIFGYPVTHEDEAFSAILAGLACKRQLTALDYPPECRPDVRIGIATGVAITQRGQNFELGAENDVVGEPLEVAQRLSSGAVSGDIVAAQSTIALTDTKVTFRAPPEEPKEAEARCVERISDVIEGSQAGFLTTNIDSLGREPELEIFNNSWDAARQGFGQILLLKGESGMGKSTLLANFINAHRESINRLTMLKCGFRDSAKAFQPIVNWIGQLTQFSSADDRYARIEKLEETLRANIGASAEQIEVTAELIGLEVLAKEPATRHWTPEHKRVLLVDTLYQLLMAKTSDQISVLVIEDLHWIDPSTLELLNRVIEVAPDAHLMIIGTIRKEFAQPWPDTVDLTLVPIEALSEDVSRRIIHEIAGDVALPRETIDIILERSDGNPLFLREITKSVTSGAEHSPLDNSTISIPSNLQDTLTARLDRLGTAKQALITGAVIGRSFSYKLLASVLNLTASDLRKSLRSLVNEEILERDGVPPDSTYRFRHALLRQAALDLIPKRGRRQAHSQVVDAIMELTPDAASTAPQLVAYHLAETGDRAQEAIPLWILAAESEAARAHHGEAALNYESALALIRKFGEDASLRNAEAAALAGLAISFAATKGYASREVNEVLQAARRVAEEIGNQLQLFRVIRGLCASSIISGDLENAEVLARECLDIGERTEGVDLLIEGHTPLGYILWLTASNLPEAKEHLLACIELYQSNNGMSLSLLTAQDPLVQSLGPLYLVNYALGDDTSVNSVHELFLETIDGLEAGFDLASALTWYAFSMLLSRNYQTALDFSRKAATLCEENGYVAFLGPAILTMNLASGCLDPEEDMAQAEAILDQARAAGHLHFYGINLAILAEIYLNAGNPEAAYKLLDEALTSVTEQGEQFWLPRIHLSIASVYLSQQPPQKEHAIASVNTAIEIADSQNAIGFAQDARATLDELKD
ncbi:MAG: AAA family ATPase [Halioglobus sp.]